MQISIEEPEEACQSILSSASLAGNLTHLDISFDRLLGGATIMPLNQLSRLQSLSLQLNCWSADVQLSLPQLQNLRISAVQHAWLTLMCPQLKSLQVTNNIPLETIDGIPDGIEDLSLLSLLTSRDCSGCLHDIFWGRRLEQLRSLDVLLSPRSYDSPVASQVIKQVLREGKLTTFMTNCPLEQLTSLTGPQCALPISLQVLGLHLPLDKGIPVVLEQLTNLRSLNVIDTEWGTMHLNRCLDPPFLNMKHLGCLSCMGKPAYSECAHMRYEWTPEALEFLMLARARLHKEAQVLGSNEPLMLFC